MTGCHLSRALNPGDGDDDRDVVGALMDDVNPREGFLLLLEPIREKNLQFGGGKSIWREKLQFGNTIIFP